MTTTNIEIPNRLFFRIGDVAELIGVKPYVLRYWETEFPSISPQKSSSGQRVYKRGDVETLAKIKKLLYEERYSIEGARKRLKELKSELRAGTLLDTAPVSKQMAPQGATLVAAPKEIVGELKELDKLLARPMKDLFTY